MVTTKYVCMSIGNGVSNNYRARNRCEGINLAPDPTVSAIEPVDRVIPLLKTAKGLVEDVELGLAGTTVASS